jgi:hypothetical protein
VRNKDGSFGDLIFSAPPNLFSFGLNELRDIHGGVNGYILPISLWKKKEPTEEENSFIEVLKKLVELCEDQVYKHIEGDFDTKRFSPLSFKRNENEIDETKSPILYTKLIYNKRDNKISTLFIDENTNLEIDPKTIVNKKCYITAAVKIESIFLGDKITLQIKLYEAIVKVVKQGGRRLLINDKKIIKK